MLLTWTLVAIGFVLVVAIAQVVGMGAALAWGDAQTTGLAYYGRSRAARDRFKKRLRRQRRWLAPALSFFSRVSPFKFDNASFVHEGVAGPKGTCSPESFAAVDEHQAGSQDVFVVTQMKCGTTWMQHVVYEVLMRGAGDLVESDTTLYAVSPWIEARKSVPISEAPLVGEERPSRIIKTHLPVQLCPWSPDASYVYVARHPGSCFASCVDFLETNTGPFMPDLETVERWFSSEGAMWWGTWPDHVKGWWERAQKEPNVLFVFFEDMKRDLAGTVRRVADFLRVAPLTEDELAAVVHKCGFDYMKQHATMFEMHPPHLLQADARLFVSGRADRHKDVPVEMRQRVLAWCAEEMRDSGFPLERAYPDVASARS